MRGVDRVSGGQGQGVQKMDRFREVDRVRWFRGVDRFRKVDRVRGWTGSGGSEEGQVQ